MSVKPDCYKCKFRGTVAGSAHSSCNVLTRVTSNEEELQSAKSLEIILSIGIKVLTIDGSPATVFNEHGKKKGWAN